eukprot:2919831-Pyramimonas_sp.AAC.1
MCIRDSRCPAPFDKPGEVRQWDRGLGERQGVTHVVAFAVVQHLGGVVRGGLGRQCHEGPQLSDQVGVLVVEGAHESFLWIA